MAGPADGLERLLRIAAKDPGFKADLISKRSRAAIDMRVELDAVEADMLDAVPAETLEMAIEWIARNPGSEINHLFRTSTLDRPIEISRGSTSPMIQSKGNTGQMRAVSLGCALIAALVVFLVFGGGTVIIRSWFD